jgi:N-acetylmuramic acid 6-phosphate etherase
VVVGVSASGITPFVEAALAAARQRGAATVLIVCNPGRPRSEPDVITLACGPEVLVGSTRLKAGTATKLVLNMLTTASMARLGRVYGNRMVDLRPRSAKLRDRALRLVQELAGVSRPTAARALTAAGQRVRLAVVIARTSLGPRAARRLLSQAGGLRAVLEGADRRGPQAWEGPAVSSSRTGVWPRRKSKSQPSLA